jgi:hypothetical protein
MITLSRLIRRADLSFDLRQPRQLGEACREYLMLRFVLELHTRRTKSGVRVYVGSLMNATTGSGLVSGVASSVLEVCPCST